MCPTESVTPLSVFPLSFPTNFFNIILDRQLLIPDFFSAVSGALGRVGSTGAGLLQSHDRMASVAISSHTHTLLFPATWTTAFKASISG